MNGPNDTVALCIFGPLRCGMVWPRLGMFCALAEQGRARMSRRICLVPVVVLRGLCLAVQSTCSDGSLVSVTAVKGGIPMRAIAGLILTASLGLLRGRDAVTSFGGGRDGRDVACLRGKARVELPINLRRTLPPVLPTRPAWLPWKMAG